MVVEAEGSYTTGNNKDKVCKWNNEFSREERERIERKSKRGNSEQRVLYTTDTMVVEEIPNSRESVY